MSEDQNKSSHDTEDDLKKIASIERGEMSISTNSKLNCRKMCCQ